MTRAIAFFKGSLSPRYKVGQQMTRLAALLPQVAAGGALAWPGLFLCPAASPGQATQGWHCGRPAHLWRGNLHSSHPHCQPEGASCCCIGVVLSDVPSKQRPASHMYVASQLLDCQPAMPPKRILLQPGMHLDVHYETGSYCFMLAYSLVPATCLCP